MEFQRACRQRRHSGAWYITSFQVPLRSRFCLKSHWNSIKFAPRLHSGKLHSGKLHSGKLHPGKLHGSGQFGQNFAVPAATHFSEVPPGFLHQPPQWRPVRASCLSIPTGASPAVSCFLGVGWPRSLRVWEPLGVSSVYRPPCRRPCRFACAVLCRRSVKPPRVPAHAAPSPLLQPSRTARNGLLPSRCNVAGALACCTRLCSARALLLCAATSWSSTWTLRRAA